MQFRPAKFCGIRLLVFMALVCVLVIFLFDVLRTAFLYNVAINSVILTSFVCGITIVFHRLRLYNREYSMLLNYDKLKKHELNSTRIIRPLSLYVTKNNKLVSQAKVQTIMASIEKKVDDYCALPKYISGILIFLGLLGTFWGLSHTIGNVANIIDNLGIDQADAAQSFVKLKDSLKIPLSGMGIAFGCSLFGLSSSLILGFLNINQRRVADVFVDKIEEWVTKHTVSFDAVDNLQLYHGPVFSMGLLEKTIETIYAFQLQIKSMDNERISLLNTQRDLAQKISQLTDAMIAREDGGVLREILKKLDAIDSSIIALVHEEHLNREFVVDSVGKEIRLVSKTLSSLITDK